MMRRCALASLLSLSLSACTVMDAVNPFSSSKPKIPSLEPITATVKLNTEWRAELSASARHVFTPAIIEDDVFAADESGTVAKFHDGKTLWRVPADKLLSGGVGSDGRQVVVGTEKGDVLSFSSADGAAQWRAKVGSEVLAPPVVTGELVLVRSSDGTITALDALDGKRRWTYTRSNPALSLRADAGMAVTSSSVLAGFPGGKLVSISLRSGTVQWEATVALPRGATELERIADVASTPVVTGAEVCAVAFQGRAACFDLSNGNALWAREMSSSTGLDADARYVYVSDEKGAVHALDRYNGGTIWKNTKLTGRGLSRPLSMGSNVLVADSQGVIHVLQRDDGALIGRLETGRGAVLADPGLLGRGYESALIQTQEGSLVAVKVQ